MTTPVRRTVRSYVLRAGRMTASQTRAVDELWPVYGIDYTAAPIDLDLVFGRTAPTVVEIGFGNGESLAQLALANPERNYLGIEVHPPGIGHLLIAIRQHDIRNIRISRHDAVEVLRDQVADDTLAGVNLFFPDPWPKKRHHKRRIVQTDFVELVARKLRPGGELHLATDWEPYAEQIHRALSACRSLRNQSASGQAYASRPADRAKTKFETRGEALGHSVRDFCYRKATQTDGTDT